MLFRFNCITDLFLKKFVILVPLFLFAVCTLAQTEENDYREKFALPSPNAANLGSFGNIPVNLYTGAVGIDIPLCELKGRQLSMPVSVSCKTSGIRLTERPSRIGMGWTLHAGGAVSRVVRGIPDELETYDANQNNYTGGCQIKLKNRGVNLFSTIFDITKKVNNIENDILNFEKRDNPTRQALSSVRYGWLDKGWDDYHFTVGGKSGSIVWDDRGKPHFMEKCGLKILKDPFNNNTDSSWVFLDQSGIEYTFKQKEHAVAHLSAFGKEFDSTPWGRQVRQCGDHFPHDAIPLNEYGYISAWYLTMVSMPSEIGGETITLKYNEAERPYSDYSISQNLLWGDENQDFYVKKKNKNFAKYFPDENKNSKLFTDRFVTTGRNVFLESIENNRGDMVVFQDSMIYELTPPYHHSAKTRFFDRVLKHITMYDRNENEVRKFTFHYKEGQKGDKKNKKMFLHRIFQSGKYFSSEPETVPPYTFRYYDDKGKITDNPQLQPSWPYPFAQDYWGYYNGNYNNKSLIPTLEYLKVFLTNDREINLKNKVADDKLPDFNNFANRHPNSTAMKLGTIAEITYPTGGKTVFEYEPHKATMIPITKSYITGTEKVEMIVGGLRIRRIWDYDKVSHAVVNERTFHYENAILTSRPNFYHEDEQEYVIRREGNSIINNGKMSKRHISSNSISLLPKHLPNHIVYGKVTERFSNGSSLVYHYDVQYMSAPNPQPFPPFQPPALSKHEAENGKLIKLVSKDLNGKTVEEKVYSYKTKRFDQMAQRLAIMPKLIPNFYGGESDLCPATLLCTPEYHLRVYASDYASWVVQDNQKTISFRNGKKVKEEESYEYNKNIFTDYTVLKKKSSIDSEGNSHEWRYSYSCDKDLQVRTPSSVLDNMNAHNYIKPLIKEHYVNDVLVDRQETVYKGLGEFSQFIPAEIYKWNSQKNIDELVMQITNMDDTDTDVFSGNGILTGYTDRNGVPHSFILHKGYDRVAEVIGLSKDQLDKDYYSIVKGIRTHKFSESPDLSKVKADVAYLKSTLKPLIDHTKYQVKFKTMAPQIGLTSETDTNGRSVYYTYDALGRLKAIVDNEGNMVKDFEYHYKGQ